MTRQQYPYIKTKIGFSRDAALGNLKIFLKN